MNLAHAAVNVQANNKGDSTKSPCGYKHFYATAHSCDYCYSNPKIANKPEVKRFLAKKKAAKDKLSQKSGKHNYENSKLKATIAAQKSVFRSERRKTQATDTP